MKNLLKRKRFFNVIALMFLASFLVFPNISLGSVEVDDFDLKELEKHLSFPEREAETLMHSLINVFHSEWLNLMVSPSATAEELAVPMILRQVVRAQVLNHLLVDAPVKTILIIVQGSIKITKYFLTQNFGEILDKIEKETVDRALSYGIEFLLQNQIRISPGAIEFKYTTNEKKEVSAIIQYIIVYKPANLEKGEVLIRFFSPDYLKIPKNQGYFIAIMGTYTELTSDLPPFIADVRGNLKNYKWVDQPTISVDFSSTVPDLGIKPLSFFERLVLKPFESMIGDVQVMITKITGKKIGLVDIWKEIKSFVSKIKDIFTATVIEPQIEEMDEEIKKTEESIPELVSETSKPSEPSELPSDPLPPQSPPILQTVTEMSLEELQEMIDEIARQIAFLSQELAKLAEEQEQLPEEEVEEIDYCININTAPEEELIQIIHIGIARAQQIIQLREERLFSSVEDLIRVSGIGLATLTAILNQNLACVGPEAPKPIEETGETGGTPSPTPKNPPVEACSANSIDINKASKEELEKLIGVGPVIAQKIIEKRPFSSLAGLLGVDGIGQVTLDKIINQGCAFVEGDEGGEQNEPGEDEEEEAEEENGEIPTLKVVINEVAWMGTKANTSGEWLELYNPSSESIDMSDWEIIFYPAKLTTNPWSIEMTPTETTTPVIEGLSYFLLERGNDGVVSDIKADIIYTGALNNEGGTLELRDKDKVLIDKVNKEEWFAGKNKTKQSMERINPLESGTNSSNWASNNMITRNGLDSKKQNINGTPRAENSVSKKETRLSHLPFDEGEDKYILFNYGSPYLVVDILYVREDQTLIIKPGVVLKFYDSYSGMNVHGTLEAIGTAEEKIVFTSCGDEEYGGGGGTAGSWRQLFFGNTSVNSELDHVIFRYGGAYPSIFPSDYHASTIFVDNSSIIIKNSTIEDSRKNGIYLNNSSSTIDNVYFYNNRVNSSFEEKNGSALNIYKGEPIIENCLFEDNINGIIIKENSTPMVINNIFRNNKAPVFVGNALPSFTENQAEGNDFDGILIKGNIERDLFLESSLPYFVEDDITIQEKVTLTLEPGVIMKFRHSVQHNRGTMIVFGKLEAIGTAEEKIVFTSCYDQKYGDATNSSWQALRFYSSGSILDNVIVRHAGGTYGIAGISTQNYGAITLGNKDIEITLRNSILEENKYALTIYNNYDCSLIRKRAKEFISNNTIFQNNSSDLFPIPCSLEEPL